MKYSDLRYIKDQLRPIEQSLEKDNTYMPTIKIVHNGTSTKFINISEKQFKEIQQLLITDYDA